MPDIFYKKSRLPEDIAEDDDRKSYATQDTYEGYLGVSEEVDSAALEKLSAAGREVRSSRAVFLCLALCRT
jgi:hypothetical protein